MPGRGGVVAVYALLTTVVLLPILSVRVPCLGDYLNHLARISIMARLGSSPALDSFYEPHWKFVPYYGMDLPMLALMHFMGIYQAGRLFAAVCVLAPVAAVVALRRAALGRVGVVPLAGFLFCYNYLFSRGLFPYLFTAGLAIGLFAAWISTTRWPHPRRVAVFSAGAMAVYLGHAFGFAAYCILVAGFEIDCAWRRGFQPWRGVALRWMEAAAPALPVLAVGAALGGNENVSAGAFTRFGGFADKIGALLSPAYFESSLATTATLIFLLVCAMVFGWRVRVAPALRGPAIAVAIVALATPRILFNIWGGDLRLPLVLVVVLLAGVMPASPVQLRDVRLALAACTLLVILRAGEAWGLLHALDAQVSSMRALVTALPQGAKLLVVETGSGGPRRVAPSAFTGHLGMIAAVDRQAFVPFLFIGNTPVVPRPALRTSSSPISTAIDMDQLWDGSRRRDPPGGPPGFGWGGTMYWLGWPGKFDHVLIEHFGAPPDHVPDDLRLLRRGSIADVYEIEAGARRPG